VDSSMRYFGCAAGFGFGVLWMSLGLGSAIVCLLLAALGYGVVFVAERARAEARPRLAPSYASATEPPLLPGDGLEPADEDLYERSDDATSPLAAEAEYGWPLEQLETAGTPRG
jgi:hypothetical protein